MNLAVLERSVRVALAGQAGGGATLFLFARFLLLITAVGVVLTRTGVAPLPFVVGLLALVPAAIWFGVDKAAERSQP